MRFSRACSSWKALHFGISLEKNQKEGSGENLLRARQPCTFSNFRSYLDHPLMKIYEIFTKDVSKM